MPSLNIQIYKQLVRDGEMPKNGTVNRLVLQILLEMSLEGKVPCKESQWQLQYKTALVLSVFADP
jgi:hypothetical protein